MSSGYCYGNETNENTLRVRVERRTSSRADLTVYINGQRMTKVEDKDWLRGKGTGVFVQPRNSDSVHVYFDDFYVNAN